MVRVLIDSKDDSGCQSVYRLSTGEFLERSVIEGAKILRVRCSKEGKIVLKLELRSALRGAISDE